MMFVMMLRVLTVLTLSVSSIGAQTPAQRIAFDKFEVATVKPVKADARSGRFFRMEGTHRWVAVNFTLERLIALAYDLNPQAISGGPDWIDSQLYSIVAVTPGDVQPSRFEQMRMLRALLVERFALKFHRQDKEFSIYELTVANGGTKLKPAANPEDAPQIIGVVYPGKIEVPAKSVTMDDFVAMLQRATLDRPTLNKTGLKGKYDFTLDWAQDETQYGGEIPKAPEDAQVPSLFTAMQEQLGLKLTPTRGTVSAIMIESAQRPRSD